jgi:hypothetical protein
MLDFNRLNNDMIISTVKDLFLYTFSPLIEGGQLDKETANRYFKTLFESGDIVKTLRDSFDSSNTRIDFRGVEFTTDEVEVTENMGDEFVTVKVHSFYDDFVLYEKEEYEPRDCAYYVTYMFKPHDNVYNHIM